MGKIVCIYCLKSKEGNLFDREHVIPESFGRFIPNNLTLINTVCEECNSYFGIELEPFLARDSLDGIMRYKYGLKKFGRNGKKFKSNRVRIKISTKGVWEGALLELCPPREEKESPPNAVFIPKADVVLIPQITFYKTISHEEVHLPLDQITNKEDLIRRGFDLEKGCILIAPSDKSMEKIKAKIKEMGLKTKVKKYDIEDNSKPVKGQLIKVLFESTVDNIIFRSVAKISFNYLAKAAGKEFVLSSCFDEIREYIRYGKEIKSNLVRIIQEPILETDTLYFKQTDGHLIVVNWGDDYNLSIIGYVSLFNRLTYQIILCNFFRGIVRKIASGHHFDIHSKKISKLKHHRYSILNI